MSEISNITSTSPSNVKKANEGLGKYLAGRSDIGWIETRTLPECQTMLPTFRGQKLEDLVSGLQQEAVVLDYGCGDKVVALSELSSKFPQINCEGVTYPLPRNDLPQHEPGVVVFRQDGDSFLRKNTNRYDLIYSVQAFRYSPDHFRTLKLAYGALKKGGVLLVDRIFDSARPLIHKDGSVVTSAELQKILIDLGYQVEIEIGEDDIDRTFSIAIKKTANHLKLPFRLVNHPDLKKELFQRFDTPFEAIGVDHPTEINYVYELIE